MDGSRDRRGHQAGCARHPVRLRERAGRRPRSAGDHRGGRRGAVARRLAAAASGLLLAVSWATPAAAHAGEAPQGADYRVTVTGITPAVPGLTVRALEAGAQIELANRTGRTISVLGYAGEPYLELRPDGVYQNTRSPATYLNQDRKSVA